MREIGINEIKKYSFEVLCRVRDLCEANGIRYSLTGGTLIGAVRHQGFIPWDDDIDIMMPRPDYDRFVELVKAEDRGFDLLCFELRGSDYRYSHAKACHRGTRLVENGMQEDDLPLGVFVDIFPIDGAGNNKAGTKLRGMTFTFVHGLKIARGWKKYRRSKLRGWYYEPFRFVCYLISHLFTRRFIDRRMQAFLRRKKYEKCAYVGRLVGDYGSREIMPREDFDGYIDVTFEGETFKAISGYDAFLTRLYGGYMTLPPEEKRVTHHEFTAYALD
jgi:lipopolysaccharide cholinephosphotransferase